jgi:hypothetical protein
VGRWHVGDYAHGVPFLVGELDRLIEHQDAFGLGAGDEEELFVKVGGQLLKALVEKQRADNVTARPRVRPPAVFGYDPREAFQEFIRAPDLRAHTRSVFPAAGGLVEAVQQLFALLDKDFAFFFKMICFYLFSLLSG